MSDSVSHTLVAMAMTQVERDCSLWGKHWCQTNSFYNSDNTWSLWGTMWGWRNRWTSRI